LPADADSDLGAWRLDQGWRGRAGAAGAGWPVDITGAGPLVEDPVPVPAAPLSGWRVTRRAGCWEGVTGAGMGGRGL